MDTLPLSSDLLGRILARWGLPAGPPSFPFLAQLLSAYVRHVPWETASRITQKANTPAWPDCARLGAAFWEDNLTQGSGGTCFESNYAFFTLLRALGYEGYLTINNMGEQVGCHTGVVLTIAGEKWLADVGIPVYAPLRVDSTRSHRHASDYHDYTITPLGEHHYQIERTHHIKPIIFTLVDRPVPDAAYRQATINDYGPDGLFLSRLILTKVIGAYAWLYNPEQSAGHLFYFRREQRGEIALARQRVRNLAAHFQMDERMIQQALELLGL